MCPSHSIDIVIYILILKCFMATLTAQFHHRNLQVGYLTFMGKMRLNADNAEKLVEKERPLGEKQLQAT